MSERTEVSKVEESMPERRRSGLPTITPVVNIFENDEEILLHADMPGINKEEININIDNGRLVLSGIRKLDKHGAASWEEFGDAEYRRGGPEGHAAARAGAYGAQRRCAPAGQQRGREYE